MEQSILTSTKEKLGLAADYTVFDSTIVDYINTVFSTLNQLGVGPVAGFMVTDATTTWEEYIPDNDVMLNGVKTYMYLRVRLLFDPPQTSYLISAMESQVEQFEWRLNVLREGTEWVNPNPPEVVEP